MQQAVRTEGPADSYPVSSGVPGPITHHLTEFAAYCTIEWNLSPRTVSLYIEKLRKAAVAVGDAEPSDIGPAYVQALKRFADQRGWSPRTANSMLGALKAYLRFLREACNFDAYPPSKVRYIPVPARQVVFLTEEEVARFIASIPHYDQRRLTTYRWLVFRTLVEVFLSTAMRIAECLSLTTTMIDLRKGEAVIIGKGNKQRTVYFTPRAIAWVERLLKTRRGRSETLFTTLRGTPITPRHLTGLFGHVRKQARIEKSVTPHILRHTVATQLVFNGCPINLVKEILGHASLNTTCDYYLGTDTRVAKDAFDVHLRFNKAQALPGDTRAESTPLPPGWAVEGARVSVR
jgi:site-specific recombinase XerD